jgi:pyruvate/2-oxoglutarate dehydrogenase complex dihydrolipoamide acyltransferase (E2) component
MPNVPLRPHQRSSMWRKMSFANWSDAKDPTVYGRVEVDMAPAMAYAAAETKRTGEKVTPTHMIVRALALGLRDVPPSNVCLRLDRSYERKSVDIFCQIAIPGEKPDLSGATLRQVDTKTPPEIAKELRDRATLVREGKDKEFGDTRKLMNFFPVFVMRFLLWVVGFLSYTFNLDLRWAGLPKDPFGGAMVTSIGSLGIDEAYPPLVPMSRVSLLLAIGALKERAVVINGEIVIRPICVITATFDHRVMDGFVAGNLTKRVMRYMEDPTAVEAEEAAA